MVGTISPVVHRSSGKGQPKWFIEAIIYTLSSAIGGAAVGMLLGFIGALVMSLLNPIWKLGPLLVGLAATAYSLDEFYLVSLLHPQRKRQVPSDWRYRFHPYITAGLFGLQLGAGFTTYVPTASYYILGLVAIVYSSPVVGLILFAIYGTARASLLWVLNTQITTVEEMHLIIRYINLTKPLMRQVNGLALAVVGGYLINTYLWPR